MFAVFVAFVAIVVLADNPTEAILYLALMTNFLVAVSILSKWNKVSPGYVPGDAFEDSEAKSTDYDLAPAVSFTSSPVNPPAGGDEDAQSSISNARLPRGILAADPSKYDELTGDPVSVASEYGPRYDEFDALRQNHLELSPAKKYPAELFETGDADAQLAMSNLSRNRAKRAIDDRLTRDHEWFKYLYDGELEYQENLHWMSAYEY